MKRIILAVLLSWATPAVAGDHLQPEDSILGGNILDVQYELRVEDKLSAPFLLARVVALPVAGPEYIVGIQQGPRRTLQILVREATASLQEPTAGHVAVSTCEIGIERDLAERLLWLWNEMLLDVRYDRIKQVRTNFMAIDRIDPSFVTYVFAEGGDYGELSGGVAQPAPGEKTRMLIAIVADMKTYCKERSSKALQRLSLDSADLERRLKATTP